MNEGREMLLHVSASVAHELRFTLKKKSVWLLPAGGFLGKAKPNMCISSQLYSIFNTMGTFFSFYSIVSFCCGCVRVCAVA